MPFTGYQDSIPGAGQRQRGFDCLAAVMNDADMLAVADYRGRVHERIVEEINTEGASDRFRDALDYARGLLAPP